MTLDLVFLHRTVFNPQNTSNHLHLSCICLILVLFEILQVHCVYFIYVFVLHYSFDVLNQISSYGIFEVRSCRVLDLFLQLKTQFSITSIDISHGTNA